MCGIAGVVQPGGGDPATGPPALRDAVERMTRALLHRGPDGEGLFADPAGGAALGHRRLAILDLSPAGAQPMSTPDGALTVTYNGEIYNHRELAAELAARGARFRTRTDTEVLLQAYAAWGDACLDRLNGMFAFALWDRARRRLVAARDRFGVKPFHYHVADGRLTFASEIKALFECPWVPRRPHERTVRAYLAHGWIDREDDTFFSDIRRLPPGHRLTWEEGRVRVERWWTLARPELDPRRLSTPAEDAAAAARFGELFTDAVRLRLLSDVPVGASLSGGLDSSAVAITSARLRAAPGGSAAPDARPLAAFTAAFPDPGISEEPYLGAALAAAGAVSHVVRPEGRELLELLPRLVRHHEEPFVSTSVFAQWRVAELARAQGVPVLLDGQGADEVFAGYSDYAGPALLYRLAAGQWGRFAADAAGVRATWGGSRLGVLRRTLREVLPAEVRARMGRSGPLPAWYVGPRVLPAPETNPLGGALSRALYRAVGRTSLPGLLRYADRSSMAFGVETRLPFLDYRLVEWAFGLPNDQKLRGPWAKFVVREGLRGVLPEAVRTRTRKLGFVTPEARWLRSDLAPLVRDLAASRSLAERGPVDPAAAAAEFGAFCAGVPCDTQEIWRWVNYELWCRAWWPA
ncbi:MAG: asparagine synthase (glutamine-hydrolyzing) [Planctomycetes bacterium]|nr:asparagine synthase (glutamine-hydrolyzing) [Planctomycetota bacterium]